MWAGACETFNPAVDQAGAPTNRPIGLFLGNVRTDVVRTGRRWPSGGRQRPPGAPRETPVDRMRSRCTSRVSPLARTTSVIAVRTTSMYSAAASCGSMACITPSISARSPLGRQGRHRSKHPLHGTLPVSGGWVGINAFISRSGLSFAGARATRTPPAPSARASSPASHTVRGGGRAG